MNVENIIAYGGQTVSGKDLLIGLEFYLELINN
jgi:hypothetical protein